MEDRKEKTIINDALVTVNTKKKEKPIKEPEIYSCDICGRTCASKSHFTVQKDFILGKSHFHVIDVKSHSQ